MRYRPEIDGLRAVAVIPVLLFHAGLRTFSGGFVGVDVFFVISGYLITSIIVADLQAGTFSLKNFYERRARRILPALFLVMFACLPFAWLWLLPQDLKSFSQSMIAVSGFFSNVLFWRQAGYFDTAAEFKPLLHTWSLAVEEQYYLAFPLFLIAAWRLGKRWVSGLLAVALLTSFLAAQWASSARPMAAFYLLPARGWELLIGVLVALHLLRGESRGVVARWQEVGGVLGLVLIAYAVVAFDSQTPFPSFYALAPTLGTALLILFATSETFVGRLLANKILVGIGLISYSAYLWHLPMLVFARHRSIDAPPKAFLGALAIASLIPAYFSWKYVEVPFRDKRKYSRRHVFSYAIAGSAFFVALGGAGYLSDGVPSRVDSAALVMIRLASDQTQWQCDTGGIHFVDPAGSCILGDQKHLVGALLGDSHAAMFAAQLAKTLSGSGQGLRQMTYDGCPPISSFYRAGDFRCLEYNKSVKAAIAPPVYSTLVVAARWTVFAEQTPFDNGEGGVELANIGWFDAGVSKLVPSRTVAVRKKAILQSYIEGIRDFLRMGKRVILIYPVPEAGWNVPIYFAKKEIFQAERPDLVTTSYRLFRERNRDTIQALDSIGEDKNLFRIRPDKILCDIFVKDRCVVIYNGVSFYDDSSHLSNAGAKLVVDQISRTMNR